MDQKVIKVPKEPKVSRDIKDIKDQSVTHRKDQVVLQVIHLKVIVVEVEDKVRPTQVQKVQQVLLFRVQLVQAVIRVHWVMMDQKVIRVLQVQKDLRDIKDIRVQSERLLKGQ